MRNALLRIPRTFGMRGQSTNGKTPHADSTEQGHAEIEPDVPDNEDTRRSNAIVENARNEFVSAFGDLARGKRNWQIIAFVLGAILLLQGLSLFRLAASAHAIPFVVQVDRLGAVSAVGPAEPLRDPDARLVASQLADFVRSVRSVLPNIAATAQADLLRRGYAFATPTAAAFLNSYLAEPSNDPRILGRHLTRDVQMTSAIRVPEPGGRQVAPGEHQQTWRLQWLETDRPLDAGDSVVVAAWEGYVTLQIVPPKKADVIQENPLGIRITSVTWTRVAARPAPRAQDSTAASQLTVGGVP
jgi:type IV secretion system protein TrbF